MNLVMHNHLTKRIFKNESGYYGAKWVSYNSGYGIGFWQQVTKYYKRLKNLEKNNTEFIQ